MGEELLVYGIQWVSFLFLLLFVTPPTLQLLYVVGGTEAFYHG